VVASMVVAQATGGAYALSLSLLIAVIYLAVVRFMDINEKEPLWAVGLLFSLGAVFAAILLTVSSPVLELNVLWESVSEELAKFAAFALGAVALAGVARSRGWSEINGLMDGIVYGTAVGFGFATGEAFVRELYFGGALSGPIAGGPLAALWSTALSGLSEGLFGAIIGAGLGAAVGARSAARRVGYPIAGLLGAIVVHALYLVLAEGNAFGGSAALVRTWAALLIPLLLVVGVVVYALVTERRIIREELEDEAQSGTVTPDELRLLRSFVARRSANTRKLLGGDFDGWLASRSLQNRQVQLALAKNRVAGETDPAGRVASEAEVERLRASVLWMKQDPQSAAQPPSSAEGSA
jgi:RsiW-degrading membrane proteinase PrsW (M82 family)